MAEQRHVWVERMGSSVRVVLDRPPVNVADIALLDELADAVALATCMPRAKVLVLTGAGRAFCTGVDVRDHTDERVESMLGSFSRALDALLSVEIPVVAAVNGAALGGGLELALACDVILVRENATLGQPEVRLGVFPPAAAALLPRRIGWQSACDLVLTGRAITGSEAQAMGLARALPAAEFDAGVAAYVETLCASSLPVLKLAKRALRAGMELPLGEALVAADRMYLRELMALRDPHEGLAAFMEKRAPVWIEA